ncbi:two-component response regulator ARR17 [Geobacter sp. OR-1]|uniref:response regulator n=1 Tax=Geobacter sp. OR-1 TaxID=1266765 RepID=UPI0005433590|nr:response regulator [Geobacter sp. OR-1]GAM09340.1 two-component response regulator ARR17 [Geobacter sp. OR-1]
MVKVSDNMGLWIEEEQRKLAEIKKKLSRISSIPRDTALADEETIEKPSSRSTQLQFFDDSTPTDSKEFGNDSDKDLMFLLVEDNLEDEFLILRLLTKLKFYNVKVVRHGQEALNFLFGGSSIYSSELVQEKPDLILLDIRMPIMDGVEFLERASDSLRNNGIPVVITTSSYQEKNVTKCEELGAKAYLRKPIYIDELDRVIKHSVGCYFNQA